MMKNFEHDFVLPPFPGFPSASRFVPVGPVLETFSRVSRSVLAREAISLVIGPPGTGKSLVCALLAKEFATTHDVVALGETPIADDTAFYRFLLHRLGVPLETGKRDDFELMIHDRLCGPDAKPHGALLVIDEAASLSADVLEAIRRLTNLMRDGQPMVSAVVAGGVKLDETLTAPSLEPFVQRVTARCYLHPLNADETRRYIRQSIEVCDASSDDTIADKAISAIYHATSGVPRLINQLMTEAIDCAAELGESVIDEHTVDKAWASLQQLPSPMIEEPRLQPESSVVEFGQLSDPDVDTDADASPRIEAPQLEPAEETLAAAEELVAEQEEAIESEAADAAVSAVPDPISLFGEFEDEENIEVGVAQVKAKPNEPSEVDLETMLHSQIVGLSQFVSENTASRYSEYDSLAVFEEPGMIQDSVADESRKESLEDSLEASLSGPSDGWVDEPVAEAADEPVAEAGKDLPSVVWYDEPAQADDAQGSAGQDDTDLLWITEDIDVDRKIIKPASAGGSHRIDQPSEHDAPKLTVDYREMLEKMRNQA
ncbi:tRNA(Met) cytidine acetyltransferase TmcA [Stieleria neptunia]|uniref:tRNA(Met) cytidine acetyltransferase TmcA n=1 Tax=Stieleria neptunia TaxID=2527979 RepID=A0A518HRB1_9BACT|nr:AAA family ATPase [Stieleria neptunia]QDV43374.1 tRNA(Met) cytidine acetyltransferase TmcA [Stieleria neptunia]